MPPEIFRTVEDVRSKIRSLDERGGAPLRRFQVATEVVSGFDQFAYELYQLRGDLPSTSPKRIRVEDLATDFTQEVLSLREAPRSDGIYRQFVAEYRRIWTEEFPLFIFCLYFFIASSVIGWSLGYEEPELASVLIPQPLIERIIDHEAWFQELQKSPFLGGLGIAWNNIRVSINAFVASLLLGIGGLLLLCYNGLLIGAIFGVCTTYDFDEALGDFVVAHGPLELTIIIAAAFGGLIFGRVFFQRPYTNFARRIAYQARRAGIVLLGILPWLIITGFVESIISPWNLFSTEIKFSIGLALALIFWLWTFSPLKKNQAEREARTAL